eukprot:TRINITY_DN7159_c0_g1_i1.p1 TRINITY_DN7159_c0_g1~~TRINITY_DN7159_c0_g1_i1.p1  ORF type:complete len:127 (-),score=25.30 TRINITY_DN7159_c0_g1_i1:4-384(-)
MSDCESPSKRTQARVEKVAKKLRMKEKKLVVPLMDPQRLALPTLTPKPPAKTSSSRRKVAKENKPTVDKSPLAAKPPRLPRAVPRWVSRTMKERASGSGSEKVGYPEDMFFVTHYDATHPWNDDQV